VAKQFPKLTLISADDQSSLKKGLGISEGLDFVSAQSLSSVEAKRIERLIDHVCPRAGLLAVARTTSPWDLRPVVALPNEEGPSLIRFAGPDVSVSGSANSRLRELLERVSRFKDSSAGLKDWGVFEDQIWYRRYLVSSTLAHQLGGELSLEAEEILTLAGNLADETSDWHSYGIIHGHIVSSNIMTLSEGGVWLLDPGIGAALVQAGKEGNSRLGQTVAPELLAGLPLDYSADVYGLGQILRRIVVALRKKHQFTEDKKEIERLIEPYVRLATTMVDTNAERRPKLAEVRAYFKDIKATRRSKAASGQGEPHKSRKHPSQGRILRPGTENYQAKQVPASPKEEPIDRGSISAEQNGFGIDEEEEGDFFGFEPGLSTTQSAIPFIEEVPSSLPERKKYTSQSARSDSTAFWFFSALLCLLLVGVWYYFRGIAPVSDYYTADELRLKWASGIPSRMVTVAQMALTPGSERSYAEEVIIRSANNGDQLPSGVDIGLLRVAFNNRWEKELGPEDRRMALALGLAGLLETELPQDLGPLAHSHPGVILAVASSAGRNVNRFLKTIPASVLTKLPPPYGPAFLKLIQGMDEPTCAEESVQQFARLSTRGVERSQELTTFLRENSKQRLLALAVMFSEDNQLAKQLLDVLLNHPNISLELPEVKWAKEWGLANWNDLEPGDQLFVLAGAPPASRVSLDDVGKMFMHPAPEIRAYAIQQALDRIKFVHPGTVTVMQKVEQRPDLLTPEQLFKLAELLEKPANVSDDRVKAWLNTEPAVPVELIADLLVATSEESKPTRMDALLALYLKKKGWEPDVSTLKRLSMHPDNYTRLFAYSQIYKMKDQDTARVFLKTALAKEKSPDYQHQLELMISQLK
jgi:hypothetical protein